MAGHKEQIIYIKFCFNHEKPAFETHEKGFRGDIIIRTQTCERYSRFISGHTVFQDFERSVHVSRSWTRQKSVSSRL